MLALAVSCLQASAAYFEEGSCLLLMASQGHTKRYQLVRTAWSIHCHWFGRGTTLTCSAVHQPSLTTMEDLSASLKQLQASYQEPPAGGNSQPSEQEPAPTPDASPGAADAALQECRSVHVLQFDGNGTLHKWEVEFAPQESTIGRWFT